MSAPLSNFLADLAERAGAAFRTGQARSVETAAAWLDCGRLLAEAKAECKHGQWLPFLARADIPKRTAQRMIRLAASGVTAETLAAHGVRAAMAALARPTKSVTVTHLQSPGAAPDHEKPDPVSAPRPPRDAAARERHATYMRDWRAARKLPPADRTAARLAAAARAGRSVQLSADEAGELAGMIGRKER